MRAISVAALLIGMHIMFRSDQVLLVWNHPISYIVIAIRILIQLLVYWFGS
jgi:ACR3 family arsenite efflux pump ArsB